ncbi:hypothetical protein ACET3Z_002551 [Daucus carota]
MSALSRNSSGLVQEPKKAKTQEEETKSRLCDFCGEDSKAVLYCRADAAKLCLRCDFQVHSTNQLFTKHSRYLLCDSCDASPCSIFCSNHGLVLCQNCDWESHGSGSVLHDRRPLDGFSGCPSVTELLATFGIEDLGQRKKKSCGFDDYLIWDTPCIVGLDDLIVSDGSDHNFVATGVPPLPKNRNAVCGQHKEEIISQLRQMVKLEPNFGDDQFDIELFSGFQSSAFKDNCQQKDACFDFEHNMEATYLPSNAAGALKYCSVSSGEGEDLPSIPLQNFFSTDCKVPDGKPESVQSLNQGNSGHGTQVDASVNVSVSQIFPKVAPREFSSQERDNALTRYKEKKKCRRYEKKIRYESRKIRAESRERIRGRFAKKDH